MTVSFHNPNHLLLTSLPTIRLAYDRVAQLPLACYRPYLSHSWYYAFQNLACFCNYESFTRRTELLLACCWRLTAWRLVHSFRHFGGKQVTIFTVKQSKKTAGPLMRREYSSSERSVTTSWRGITSQKTWRCSWVRVSSSLPAKWRSDPKEAVSGSGWMISE